MTNKVAREAARRTASILVKNLSPCIVHEIRLLSKFGNDCRAFVEEAGAVPLLVPLLYSEDAGL